MGSLTEKPSNLEKKLIKIIYLYNKHWLFLYYGKGYNIIITNNNIMCRFIKLTKLLINTKHIVYIEKKNELYQLQLQSQKLDGLFIIWFGNLTSTNNMINVCKKEHPKDYDIMEKWVTSEK